MEPTTLVGVTHGFKLTGGRFTTIDYPGAVNTDVRGINNRVVFRGSIAMPTAYFVHPKNGSWRTVERSTLVRRGGYVEGDCHLNGECH